MLASALIEAVERLAPPALAEPWDNTGLLAGDAAATLDGPVLLTIDLSRSVLDEATTAKASAILAYHPPLFRPIRRLTTDNGRQELVLRALRAGILLYSPHTALDAAPGGLNDWLARATGTGDTRALRPTPVGSPKNKIVTFVPVEHAEQVRSALASSGAGRIGAYERCSFSTPGTGTFFGGEGSNPAVGQAGRLETVNELRLEMICPQAATPLALEALRAMHPYEEPAIDVYPLSGTTERGTGVGRRVTLDQPTDLAQACERVKAHLGIERLKYASPNDEANRPVRTVGFCAGSGAELIDDAVAADCDLLVTGEMSHHEILAATDKNLAVILAGHTNTERGYLPEFAKRLAAEAPQANFLVSSADRPPVRWV